MMKTAGKLSTLLAGLAIGIAGATATLAQYGQPDYSHQPGYNQPGYNQQPGYGRPDYYQPYNQPGYGQSGSQAPGYGQPNQSFYNDLEPYGQWVQTPEYGTVWIPSVEPGFQPYASNGHWVVTEYGNTWVSDYAWGWAPFHYGRWFQDRYQRWAWVPGSDWAPAWVSWRSGGGYYGWAPLGPGLTFNVNINIPANYWTFVPQVYITSPRLYSYYVPRPRVVNIYQNTTIINNVYQANNRAYAYGPRREEIEYVTRQRVPVYRIENAGRPGRTIVQNNAVGIYRPDMSRGGRSDGNGYVNDQPTYSRRDYTPSAGAYNGNSQANSVENQRYQQRQSFPGNQNQERNSRYERESRASQSIPQPAQPYPQSNQTVQPPSQTYPQQSRQESFSRGQRDWGRRQESVSQPQTTQPAVNQPQVQQRGGYEQRGQEQVQAPQGVYPGRHGGSRGPR